MAVADMALAYMTSDTRLPCIEWQSGIRRDVDLNAKLPVLAAYMGHKCLETSQKYLHLTIDLFAGLSTRLEEKFGYAIPRRIEI